MRSTIILVSCLAGSGPAWSQVRVLPAAMVPARPVIAPAMSYSPFSLTGVPGINSILPSPKLAAPSVDPKLAAPPLLQVLAEGPGPAPVEAGLTPEQHDSLSSAMTMQGAVLGMLSRATGFDPLVLSLGMSMVGGGMTVGDWNKLGAGLQEIDSDWGEMEQVLAKEVRSPNFSEEFRQGKKISPEDLNLLNAILKDLPREVEIKRNNHYLGWLYKWGDGDPTAAGASFREHSVRRVEGGWMVTLGRIPGQAGAETLRVTLADLPGMPANARPQLDKLLASPLLTPEQRQDLLDLARELESAQLLPQGYAAAQR